MAVPGCWPVFPAEWVRFRDGVPTGDRDGDLVEAYARLLTHFDAGERSRVRGVHQGQGSGSYGSVGGGATSGAIVASTLIPRRWILTVAAVS